MHLDDLVVKQNRYSCEQLLTRICLVVILEQPVLAITQLLSYKAFKYFTTRLEYPCLIVLSVYLH